MTGSWLSGQFLVIRLSPEAVDGLCALNSSEEVESEFSNVISKIRFTSPPN